MSIEKVVVIIPTYNEALVIEETLMAVFAAVEPITTMDIHVLVFDSHSTDETALIVNRLIKDNSHLHLQTEPNKTGLGSAYRQAMSYALTELAADIVVEFDADLSHSPQYLAPMLDKMKQYDVVVGSRYVSGGKIPCDWGWHRKLLSVLGNYTSRCLLTRKFKDYTSGFRVTRRCVLLKALPDAFISNHYAYKLELFWRLYQANARIYEYPIEFVDREKGSSKLPTNSIFDSLRVLFRLRYQQHQRYITMCGVGLSGAALQYLVYNVLRQSLSPFHALQLAVLAALGNNYLLNNRFTFKGMLQSNRYVQLKGVALYMVYGMLMMSLQSYWLLGCIHYFGGGVLKENVSVFVGMILGSFLNYKMFSKVIWKKSVSVRQEFDSNESS